MLLCDIDILCLTHSHCVILSIEYLFGGEIPMANIKSAKKRILVTRTKTLRNKMIKSKVKTETKKLLNAIDAGNKELAGTQLITTITEIDKAKSKGIYHKNTAARKASRLTKLVNAM